VRRGKNSCATILFAPNVAARGALAGAASFWLTRRRGSGSDPWFFLQNLRTFPRHTQSTFSERGTLILNNSPCLYSYDDTQRKRQEWACENIVNCACLLPFKVRTNLYELVCELASGVTWGYNKPPGATGYILPYRKASRIK
jgi:hypothetical protein